MEYDDRPDENDEPERASDRGVGGPASSQRSDRFDDPSGRAGGNGGDGDPEHGDPEHGDQESFELGAPRSPGAGRPRGEGGEVVAFPGFSAEPSGIAGGDDDDEGVDESDAGPEGGVDPAAAFTEEQYMASTTREYRGLAEAIERSAREVHEQQAVAASMPGVQTGVVGFEDMTGESEVDAEVLDQAEKAERTDLFLRVGTALGLVAVLLGAVLAGGLWIAVLLGVVIILSVGEFYAAVRRAGFVPVALFGLLGSVGLLVGTWRAGPFAIAGFLAATAAATALWFSLVPRRDPLGNAAVTMLGMAWVTSLLAFAYPIFQAADMVTLVIVLVVLTALFDVASFFVGRTIGRTPLAPVLSPKKTVEGLAGGVLLTIGVGAGLGSLAMTDPFTIQSGAVLGLAVSVFAPLGDLSESLIKRLLGLKDMGSILPGHGGMLDRVDGFIFSVPAAYIVYLWFGYL